MAFGLLLITDQDKLGNAMTIPLISSIRLMLLDRILMRKPEACEKMAQLDVVCADMGTLTSKAYTCTHFWSKKTTEIFSQSSGGVSNLRNFVKESQINFLKKVVCCTMSADIVAECSNPAEIGFAEYLSSCGVHFTPVKYSCRILGSMEFNSTRKRNSVLIEEEGGENLMVVRGASELLLDSCDKLLDLSTGEVELINEKNKEMAIEAIANFGQKGLRTIGFAYSHPERYDTDNVDSHGLVEAEKSGLTFVGFFGLRQLPSTHVCNSIRTLNDAGIGVKMVTGGNQTSAKATAEDCGIIPHEDEPSSEYQCMSGAEFSEFVGGFTVQRRRPRSTKSIYTLGNPENFRKCYRDLKVLYRARPDDKFLLIIGLKELGYCVATVGDGTADAPALSHADVGFCFGQSGTEIAKQASDILLIDDSFSGVVNSAKWGRNFYDSVKKIIQSQMTVIQVVVLLFIVSALGTSDYPFTITQIIWVINNNSSHSHSICFMLFWILLIF